VRDASPGGDAVDAALTRTECSRQRLRQALLPAPEPVGAAATGGRLRHRVQRWLARTPLATMWRSAWSGVQTWRQRHALHDTGVVGRRAIEDGLAPLVRRHPLASVGTAAALGAALVASRPWQWPVLLLLARVARRHALFATLGWSWRQLSKPWLPVSLATAAAAWGGPKKPCRSTPTS
jgi:hypothetical protein